MTDKTTEPSPGYQHLTAQVNGKLKTLTGSTPGAATYVLPANEQGEIVWRHYEHSEHKILEIQRDMRRDTYRFCLWLVGLFLYFAAAVILVLCLRR